MSTGSEGADVSKPTANRIVPPLRRLLRVLWLAGCGFWIVVWIFPLSSGMTRAAGFGLFLVAWFGAIALGWRYLLLRYALLGITALAAAFLVMPARSLPPAESLRDDYLKGLKRYEGVTYSWGGESPRGIDCSGLIRRGMIDSMFLRGVRSFDPGLVRHSISQWWHDTTASALGQHHDGLTVPLTSTPSLNELDHSNVLPGDLAVTGDGRHIMAYVGEKRWIEADPGIGKVITVQVPAPDNAWFGVPMNLVRWEQLSH